ncbi:MAG: hypothetical protein R2762_12910 [Bryobacteraceae bacterium]
MLPEGAPAYLRLMSGGLYEDLTTRGLMVTHREEQPRGDIRILVPTQIEFISYPYEWCFSQLRDAALLTLRIQRTALEHGMCLKDASAYNVQFQGSRPIFIDTLSFEPNRPGPWNAYDQFCRHFLAPLLLMAYRWDTFNQFLLAMPDGFPLSLTSSLLPWHSYFRPAALLHVHLHARAQASAGTGAQPSRESLPDRKQALVESLEAAVQNLHAARRRSAWSGYYEERTHYTADAERFRRDFVVHTLLEHRPALVFDLGANRGDYSRLTGELGFRCVSFEMDGACAEQAYRSAKAASSGEVLSLRMDLRNPTPGIGFRAKERMGLLDRPRACMLLALALIHHLRISGQAPLAHIARFFADLGDQHLLLEFVPKEDPMVRAMLAHRSDIFDDYTLEGLWKAFAPLWEPVATQPIPGSPRTLCLFRKREIVS